MDGCIAGTTNFGTALANTRLVRRSSARPIAKRAIKSAVAAVSAEKKVQSDPSKKDKLDKAVQKVKDTKHRIRLIEAALESAVPGHKAEISGAAAMANTPHNSRGNRANGKGTKRKDEKGAENKKKGAENKKPSRRGGKKTRTRRSRR